MVALTLAPPKILPPVILPVELITPPVNTLPPVTFALTDTVVPVWVVALTLAPPKILPPVILPVVLRLVPVAAPMLGVVSCAPVLTMILPVPSNAVVILSVLVLNTEPFSTRPADVLAVYAPAPENCVNTILLVPITTLSVVCTQPVSACVAPETTNKKSPPDTSAVVSKSIDRVSRLVLV